MASIDILGKMIPVSFKRAPDATVTMDEGALLAGARDMADKINGVRHWPPQYRDAFRGMKEIVFFEGTITVNTHPISRSCCDEDDAVFYWESSEFNQNSDADVRANTFFHDCWHVVQFQRSGRFAANEDERLEREVDAVGEQIEVARLLGCSDHEVTHLEAFRTNHGAIVARLAEGLERMFHRAGTRQA
jgi:hypothetical protein